VLRVNEIRKYFNVKEVFMIRIYLKGEGDKGVEITLYSNFYPLIF